MMTVEVHGSGESRTVVVVEDGSRRSIDERLAFRHAKADQGFVGTYEEWLSLDSDERRGFEFGAVGI